MVLCGCGRDIGRQGLYNHKRNSSDPRCQKKPAVKKLTNRLPLRSATERLHDGPTLESASTSCSTPQPIPQSRPASSTEVFDVTGDLFGDYAMLGPDDFVDVLPAGDGLANQLSSFYQSSILLLNESTGQTFLTRRVSIAV